MNLRSGKSVATLFPVPKYSPGWKSQEYPLILNFCLKKPQFPSVSAWVCLKKDERSQGSALMAEIFLHLSTHEIYFPQKCSVEILKLQMSLRNKKMYLSTWISNAVGNSEDVPAAARKEPMKPRSFLHEISHPLHPAIIQELLNLPTLFTAVTCQCG